MTDSRHDKSRTAARRLRDAALDAARRSAPAELSKLLEPSPGDTRTVLVAKRSAQELISRKERITRSSFIAASRALGGQGKTRGLAESTLDANPTVRVIFERVCSRPRRQTRRRRDGIETRVTRYSRRDILQQIDRLGQACERQTARIHQAGRRTSSTEASEQLSSMAIAESHIASASSLLRRGEQPDGFRIRSKDSARTSQLRVEAAVKMALKDGHPLTDAALATAAEVSVSTILRNPGVRQAVLAARAKRAGSIPPAPPSPDPYPGTDKRTLARAALHFHRAHEILRSLASHLTATIADQEDAKVREQARREAALVKADDDWQAASFPED